uniref:uncharacterized protein n=1 Tax=Myxine glutinosa TaxID=7769 RepID=UPI00358DF4D4
MHYPHTLARSRKLTPRGRRRRRTTLRLVTRHSSRQSSVVVLGHTETKYRQYLAGILAPPYGAMEMIPNRRLVDKDQMKSNDLHALPTHSGKDDVMI